MWLSNGSSWDLTDPVGGPWPRVEEKGGRSAESHIREKEEDSGGSRRKKVPAYRWH